MATVLIEGQEYVNSDSSWSGVDVRASSSTLLTFRNNSITSINTNGYMLCSGDDEYLSTAHNLDNAIITGNRFDWNGTPGATLCHGIMAGYNLNYNIKYNYFDGPYYGIVHEGGYDDGSSMVNTNADISYNIFRNCPTPILTMGHDTVYIYNNTFYYDLSSTNGLLRVRTSNGTTIPAPAKNVKIKNNIFYSAQNVIAIDLHSDCTTGFECDYNIYYWNSTSGNLPRFEVGDVSVSWAQWQALGYDTHSTIVDPKFLDTIDFIPTKALEYGNNVGTLYDDGLANSSKWSVGYYPDIAIQDISWQVGARIMEDPPSLTAYYVSPLGNDSNSGTIDNPWKTWGKGFNSLSVDPGDTVYFRGGVYYKAWGEDAGQPEDYYHVDNKSYQLSRTGTDGNLIKFYAYPGETPVLDSINIEPTTTSNYAIRDGTSYAHFKGLHIRNVLSPVGGVENGDRPSGTIGENGAFPSYTYKVKTGSIVYNGTGYDEGDTFLSVSGVTTYTGTGTVVLMSSCECVAWKISGSDTLIENCVFHDIDGIGFQLAGGAGLVCQNCDAYNCNDIHAVIPQLLGQRGSGFSGLNSTMGYAHYTVRYCRAWNCGDQGFSSAKAGTFIYDGCWSWDNGLLDGGGHGFKVGWAEESGIYSAKTVKNCIAVHNRESGITTNDLNRSYVISLDVYNNLLYNNGYTEWVYGGYGIMIYNTLASDTEENKRVFKNNISYDNELGAVYTSTNATYTHTNNSWDVGIATVTDDDFQSLDYTQLVLPRNSDGSLPDITFGKLVKGSDCIGVGINVGLDADSLGTVWNDPPSIGAFEYEDDYVDYIGIGNVYINKYTVI